MLQAKVKAKSQVICSDSQPPSPGHPPSPPSNIHPISPGCCLHPSSLGEPRILPEQASQSSSPAPLLSFPSVRAIFSHTNSSLCAPDSIATCVPPSPSLPCWGPSVLSSLSLWSEHLHHCSRCPKLPCKFLNLNVGLEIFTPGLPGWVCLARDLFAHFGCVCVGILTAK